MKLFIGNLSWNATEADLRKSFGRFGVISDLKIILDKDSGKSRGFGFVSYETKEAGETAIHEMDGTDFLGRALRVSPAVERR